MAKLKKLTFEIDKKDYVLSYDDAYKMYLELDKIFGEKTLKTVVSAPGKELTKQYDQRAFYYGEDATSGAYAPTSVTMSDTITFGNSDFSMTDRPKSAFSVF